MSSTINAMNSPLLPTNPMAPPIAPVSLRTGLLFLGASVATVALVGWGVARATAQVASLEDGHSRSVIGLIRVEEIIGGFPTTMADTIRVAAASGR